MVKNKTSIKKPPLKTLLPKKPTRLLWLFAISSIVIIPMAYYSPAIDATLVPKFIVTIILLLVFYGYFLARPGYFMPETGLLNRWAVICWMIFIVISVISLTGAINPKEGLFDIFMLTVGLLFLIATSSILISTDNLKPFIVAAAILAILYLAVGYYQYFAYVFRHSDLNSLYNVVGIHTHKNVFSGVFYLLVPLFLYEILTTTKQRQIVYTVLLFLVLTLLFLLQTRSIWLALFINMVLSCFFIIIFRKDIITQTLKPKIFKWLTFVGSSVLLGLIFAWFITNYSLKHPTHHLQLDKQKKSAELKNLDERATSIFNTKESNIQQRLGIWRMTFKMVRERPILGVGAGNWKILIPSYFEKGYNEVFYNNWRRPHNDFILALSEKGVIGLLAYLGFFLFLLVYSVKLLKKDIDPTLKIFIILVISGLAGYCVDASFSFPYERIEQQTFMLFYASAILWVYSVNFPLKAKIKKFKPIFLSVPAVIFLIIALFFGRTWVREEVFTKLAFAANQRGEWQKVIYMINKASSTIDQLDPRNTSILWYRGNAELNLNMGEQAQEDLEKAMAQNPNAIQVLTDLGVLYGQQGNHQLAIEMFNKALKIYPFERDALLNLGMAYYFTGKYQDALNCFQKLKTPTPNPELDSYIEKIQAKLSESKKQ